MNRNEIPAIRGEPDFSNLLAVLERRLPGRPTLFEFFLNERLYRRLVPELPSPATPVEWRIRTALAFCRAGYDYSNLLVPGFSFVAGLRERHREESISLNEAPLICSREDFDAFPWPDPDAADYEVLDRVAEAMPAGMKLIVYTPNGVLENVVDLVGYQNLCLMVIDDPRLVFDIFDEVGMRLARYYGLALQHECVGAAICNDDWGFKTQTMFSPRDMRRFVFPWHKRHVQLIHAAGRPAILHSCGHFERVIEDVIEDIEYDGRHSYEDTILPVEDAYERYGSRIAVLGGIDVDFVCRSEPEAVYRRSKAMLERAEARGGFALGTGNSVPEYVPDEGYFAMTRAALELR